MACDRLCIHSIDYYCVVVISGDCCEYSTDDVVLLKKQLIDKPVPKHLHNIRKRMTVEMEMDHDTRVTILAEVVLEIRCVALVWATQLNDVTEHQSLACATGVLKLNCRHCMNYFVPSTMFQHLF